MGEAARGALRREESCYARGADVGARKAATRAWGRAGQVCLLREEEYHFRSLTGRAAAWRSVMRLQTTLKLLAWHLCLSRHDDAVVREISTQLPTILDGIAIELDELVKSGCVMTRSFSKENTTLSQDPQLGFACRYNSSFGPSLTAISYHSKPLTGSARAPQHLFGELGMFPHCFGQADSYNDQNSACICESALSCEMSLASCVSPWCCFIGRHSPVRLATLFLFVW